MQQTPPSLKFSVFIFEAIKLIFLEDSELNRGMFFRLSRISDWFMSSLKEYPVALMNSWVGASQSKQSGSAMILLLDLRVK